MTKSPLTVSIINTSPHPLPEYMSEHAAGMDIRAYLSEDVVLEPREYKAIPTGISVALPEGYELQVRARSGLAFKHGIGLVNGVGTIDADYRGEIRILLINYGSDPFTVRDGDRIAQCVVAQYKQVTWQPVDTLDITERGAAGFGSTGLQ